MPLSEFLRMARGKLESGQQKPCPAGFSSRCDDDLLELVWENGQILMQGQSSRVTRSPTLASNNPRTHNAAITSRIGELNEGESVLDDLSPVVPSGDLDLSQDDEMVPWLNYQVDDALPHYHSEFLPEISGVTSNGVSTHNSFVSTENKNSGDQNGNVWEGSSSSARLLGSWPPHQGQISNPSLVSGVSDIVSNNTSKNVVNDSTSTKIERQNIGISSNSSNLLNSHFSRPSPVVKSYLSTSDGLSTEKIQVKGKGLTLGVSNPVNSRLVDQLNNTQKGFDFHGHSAALASSKSPPAERTENLCRKNSTENEKPLIPGNNICEATKGVPDGERSIEPLVASSSVGSGQSGDRVSCEQTHNSKRKFCDINESEFHGYDIETESAGVRKTTAGRGGVGSKRSRAAEVHNLSERRRRDRINEKMRALQELIPNCNKADKASMLDEAIEYLKTLQLQVQMMSMGAGLCMPPMMFPSGIHPAHLPHFPSMGIGMGLGMGFGMGMTDMNGGSSAYPMFHAPPMQGSHFPSPMGGPINFQRMPGPMYAHSSQGLPNSLPLAPLAPVTGRPPVTSARVSKIGSHGELHGTSQALNSENPVANKNPQLMHNAQASSSINHTSNQLEATNEVLDKSTAIQENKQATDVPGPAALTPTQATDNSKVAGCD